jgi:Tfp pilus assembly protein PilN
MFMDLEKIVPAGVRLVSIEPKYDKDHVEVKIVVGAMSDDAKLKFLHALEQSSAFSHVTLINEKLGTAGTNSNDKTEVELQAVYART